MPLMSELSDECIKNAFALAYRAAVRNCLRKCKLYSDRCRQLADEAVTNAYLERAKQHYTTCKGFQTELIYYASVRVLDQCRKTRRDPQSIPVQDVDQLRNPRPDGNVDEIDTITLREIPDSHLQRLEKCLSHMDQLDQAIYRLAMKTLNSENHGKKVKFDRYKDVLRLVHADSKLWTDLGYGPVDFSNPSDPNYQHFRKRLMKLNDALIACLKEAPLRDEQEGENT